MPDIYVAPQKSEDREEKRPKKKEKKPETELESLALVETSNPFSSFASSPVGVRFETQELEEKIILLLRKHWITNLPWLVSTIILVFAPLSLRYFPLLAFLPTRFQIMAIVLWYLLVTAFVLEQFLTWFFNVYIITDERIVDIDFYNLLYKEVSDAKIDRIQDVTYKMGGVVRALFNFGDIFIQTAGTEPNFEFRAVPRPDRVVRVLEELRTQEEIEALEGRVR